MSKKKKRLDEASAPPSALDPHPSESGIPPWLWRAALALIVVILFGRALGYPFLVPGEGTRLLNDSRITASTDWSTAFALSRPWQPLAWLSHMVDFALFGAKPEAQRFVNLLLHLANCLLVFSLFRRLTGATMQSGVTAVLFALHPLRIEPVIWLVERRTLLAAFFALLAMRAYAEFVRTPKPLWRAAVFVATALAALSHPVGAIVPVLLLLLDTWPLRRVEGLGARLAEKVELGLIAVATIGLSARAGANPEAVWTNGTFDAATRVWHSVCGLGLAALRAVTPFPLDQYPALDPPVWALAILAAALALPFVLRSREVTVAIAWFFLAMLPTLGLIQPEISPWRDSGTYLADIGLTAGFVSFLARRDRDKFVAIALGAGLLWFGLGWLRVGEWSLGETLLRASTERGGHPLAHYQLGQLLLETRRQPEAEKHIRAVLAARPTHAESRMLLASVLAETKRTGEAVSVLQESIRLMPQKPDSYYALGLLYMMLNRNREGAEQLGAAVTRGLPPELEAQAENGIGVYHLNEQRYAEAEKHLERSWKLAPKYASAHANFGRALVAQGKCRQAIAYLNRARLYTSENQEVVDVWTTAFNCNAANEKKQADAEGKGQMKKK